MLSFWFLSTFLNLKNNKTTNKHIIKIILNFIMLSKKEYSRKLSDSNKYHSDVLDLHEITKVHLYTNKAIKIATDTISVIVKKATNLSFFIAPLLPSL